VEPADPKGEETPAVVSNRRVGGTQARPEAIKAIPIRHWGRWVASAVILYIFAALIYSLAKNHNLDWNTVGATMFKPIVLRGVVVTLELTFIAMVIGIIGGTLLAVMRLSSNYVLSWLAWLYIWFFRGTPLLVQILLWGNFAILYPRFFLGLPFTGLVFGSANTNTIIGVFVAAVLALGLNEAAYAAELVRAGIISVDRGQNEAAQSLGMSFGMTMRRIVLPQAMRVIIPPMGNETISMLKSTSLIALISGKELMTVITILYSQDYKIMPRLIVACVWYLFLTTLLTIGQHYLERHYAKGFGDKEAEAAERKAMKRIERKAGVDPGVF
jgi:polar amino acid transport system permease protein